MTLFKILPLITQLVIPPANPSLEDFDQGLELPDIGYHELRVLTPRLLELYLVNSQDQPGGWDTSTRPISMLPPLTAPYWWDFLDGRAPRANAPTPASFTVEIDGQAAGIERVGFRRRSFHGDRTGEVLRVGQSIYLLLDQAVPNNAVVSVRDAPGSATPYLEDFSFETQSHPNRLSPLIHVNALGYGATWPVQDGPGDKIAHVSLFAGDLGRIYADEEAGQWMIAPATIDAILTDEATPLGLSFASRFEIIDAETKAVVFQSDPNAYTVRDDSHWPTYNGVLELDFSSLVTPGTYRLRVPGLGASMPFTIGDQMAMTLTRTLAHGLYHQRSGEDHQLPYTRFVDPPGHLAPASIPFDDWQDGWAYRRGREASNFVFAREDLAADHPAAQLRSPETSLFPFVGDVAAWWPFDGKPVFEEDVMIAGFNEGTYEGFTITDPFAGSPLGHAFGNQPARSAYPGRSATDTTEAITPQQSWEAPDGRSANELSGFHGVGFINTYQIFEPDPDEIDAPPTETRATGILETTPFTIERPWISFLIAGTNQPYDLDAGGQPSGVTAINLLVNGEAVATATGQDRNLLQAHHWDVTPWLGQTATVQIIDSSIIGYLLVDEVRQSHRDQVRDLSSHRHAGTMKNGAHITDRQSQAILGLSLVLDGDDDHVVTHALPHLTGDTALTISLWLKLDDRDRSQTVFAKGPANGVTDFALTYDGDSRRLRWRVGTHTVEAATAWNDFSWHFVSATFTANDPAGLRLWMDAPSTVATASTAGTTSLPNTDAVLHLGTDSALTDGLFLGGLMDDLRIRESVVADDELIAASKGVGPWVDVSLGHFDAGDYSKYMINSALTLHTFIFTADQLLQLPGDGNDPDPMDNLGLPESGDGIADILHAAKWEADYIVKMQDTDGGFFFLVHPRNRTFESNVLPSEGDPQVVWPKTLSSTGAAVGALVETASSPAFARHFPEDAARYMEAGMRGWEFIVRAVETHGVDGAFQRLWHYGADAEARDEVGWAAAALFAATGDPQYEARLREWMPWDTAELHGLAFGWREFRRFTWLKTYESTGAAMRNYLFAGRGNRSGRSISYDDTPVGPKAYHEHVRDEVLGYGKDLLEWTESNPYRSAVPLESKKFNSVIYFFAIANGFDLLTASLLDSNPDYFRAVLSNLNYHLGSNPSNRTFVTGLGWSQTHEIVSQFADNDERQLPPAGITVGSVNTGVPWLAEYQGLLGVQTYPPATNETDIATPYGVYHRPIDVWDVSNEFVIPIHAKAFATASYLYSMTDESRASETPAPAIQILGAPGRAEVGGLYDLEVISSEADLSDGRIVWEAPGHEFSQSRTYTITTDIARESWVEVEVLWEDGKRSYARAVFDVKDEVTQSTEQYQPTPLVPGTAPYAKVLGNRSVRLYYPLDEHFEDVMQAVPLRRGYASDAYRLRTDGAPIFDNGNFEWPNYADSRPNFRALRLDNSDDLLETPDRTLFARELFPPQTEWISVESIIYIEEFDENRGAAYLFGLDIEAQAQPVRLWLYKDPWQGPVTGIYGKSQITDLSAFVPPGEWLHVRTVMDRTHTTFYRNGEQVDQVPTEAFDEWLNPERRIKLLLGGFRGYVSDFIVKAGTGTPDNPAGIALPPLSHYSQWAVDTLGSDAEALADPDADGATNLLEYALGTDPAANDGPAQRLQSLLDGQGRTVLYYTRPIYRPGVQYEITYSTDLDQWQSFDPPLEPSLVEEHDNDTDSIYFNDDRFQPGAGGQRFVRLEITAP